MASAKQIASATPPQPLLLFPCFLTCFLPTIGTPTMKIEYDDVVHSNFETGYLFVWASLGRVQVRCDLTYKAINEMPNYRTASPTDVERDKVAIIESAKPLFEQEIASQEFEMFGDVKAVRVFAKDILPPF
jgi:hypothetical protein